MTTTLGVRSPSPPSAPPPIALTPGNLASYLSDLYSRALSKTLQSCSYTNFAACFPTPARLKPDALKSVWEQIVGKIKERAVSEFEDIMVERDVVRSLNELERLKAEAESRRKREVVDGKDGEVPIALHTLLPEQLYLAHLSPYLQQTQKVLEERLRNTRVQNEELVQVTQQQREEIEQLIGGLEGVVRDLEGANEAMDGVLRDGEMKREVSEVEHEIRIVGREAKL
ncbi:hypothetical protein MMC06_006820 [Schaereria dolodes]|nr:hypothetical protein [Schaereria dolodes]